MLSHAIQAYIDLRRACGFKFGTQSGLLRSFAAYSADRGEKFVRSSVAIDWASQAQSTPQRAHRLAIVARFARHIHVEDPQHEVPAPVFGPAGGRDCAP